MKFGLDLPNMGGAGDPHLLADIAHEAEESGWDGVFIFDSVLSPGWNSQFPDDPQKRATVDPWITLAAMAMRTERVTLGTMITPLSRRRPWKVARETVTLDHLSNGRLRPAGRPRHGRRRRLHKRGRGAGPQEAGRDAGRIAGDHQRPLERRELRVRGRTLSRKGDAL